MAPKREKKKKNLAAVHPPPRPRVSIDRLLDRSVLPFFLPSWIRSSSCFFFLFFWEEICSSWIFSCSCLVGFALLLLLLPLPCRMGGFARVSFMIDLLLLRWIGSGISKCRAVAGIPRSSLRALGSTAAARRRLVAGGRHRRRGAQPGRSTNGGRGGIKGGKAWVICSWASADSSRPSPAQLTRNLRLRMAAGAWRWRAGGERERAPHGGAEGGGGGASATSGKPGRRRLTETIAIGLTGAAGEQRKEAMCGGILILGEAWWVWGPSLGPWLWVIYHLSRGAFYLARIPRVQVSNPEVTSSVDAQKMFDEMPRNKELTTASVVRVTVSHVLCPVTTEVLHQVFVPYCQSGWWVQLRRLLMWRLSSHSSTPCQDAAWAQHELQG